MKKNHIIAIVSILAASIVLMFVGAVIVGVSLFTSFMNVTSKSDYVVEIVDDYGVVIDDDGIHITNDSNSSNNGSSVSSTGDIQCPTGTNGELQIESIAGTLQITASDDEYIHVSADGVDESSIKCYYNSRDNETVISMQSIISGYSVSSILDGSLFDDVTVYVEIPASFSGQLELSEIYGIVNSSVSFTLAELSVENVYGTVTMENISATSLDVSDIAGKVELTCNSIGRFDISDIVGKATVTSKSSITGNSEISESVGTITVNLPTSSAINVVQRNNFGTVNAPASSNSGVTVVVEEIVGTVNINTNV